MGGADFIWLNGAIVPAPEAKISVLDRGVTLGDALFETLRVTAGAPDQLDAHLSRLARTAEVLNLPLPFEAAEIADQMTAFIKACEQEEGVLRITVTRGSDARGLALPDAPEPTVFMTLNPLPAHRRTSVRLKIAGTVRRNSRSPLPALKTVNYLENILALEEARQAGLDDALLLNEHGRITSTSHGSFFWVIGDQLFTAPIAEGLRDAVSRARVIEALHATETVATPDDLANATEAFLTNSLGVRPVTGIDGVSATLKTVGTQTTAADKLIG